MSQRTIPPKMLINTALYVLIRENDFKRFDHALFGRTAADVEEVGRLAAVQLDDVHGTHGQTCTVYHAANIAFEGRRSSAATQRHELRARLLVMGRAFLQNLCGDIRRCCRC